jgi:hypothetical protein
MYVTYDKTKNARIISDCKWIAMELETDFDEACCEDYARITHIATLSGHDEHPCNQYAVEVVQDFGFGRVGNYFVYTVDTYCAWKQIREELFTELLQAA